MKALAKTATAPLTLERSNQILSAGLKAFADYISGELEPTDLVASFDTVKETEDVVESLQKNLRTRLLKTIETDGETITDKGTKQLTVDGWSVEARPTKTGYDPKKVEGLLRAKNLNVNSFMNQVITYAVNDGLLVNAVGHGYLTQDELETCRYPLNYALQRPRFSGDSNE